MCIVDLHFDLGDLIKCIIMHGYSNNLKTDDKNKNICSDTGIFSPTEVTWHH